MIKKLILLGCIILAESTTLLAQIVKVHTIGDSTMADYVENTTRTRGWGEMLQEFFSNKVQVEEEVPVPFVKKGFGTK